MTALNEKKDFTPEYLDILFNKSSYSRIGNCIYQNDRVVHTAAQMQISFTRHNMIVEDIKNGRLVWDKEQNKICTDLGTTFSWDAYKQNSIPITTSSGKYSIKATSIKEFLIYYDELQSKKKNEVVNTLLSDDYFEALFFHTEEVKELATTRVLKDDLLIVELIIDEELFVTKNNKIIHYNKILFEGDDYFILINKKIKKDRFFTLWKFYKKNYQRILTTMLCPACKETRLKFNYNFCPNCGAKV